MTRSATRSAATNLRATTLQNPLAIEAHHLGVCRVVPVRVSREPVTPFVLTVVVAAVIVAVPNSSARVGVLHIACVALRSSRSGGSQGQDDRRQHRHHQEPYFHANRGHVRVPVGGLLNRYRSCFPTEKR